MTPQEGSSLLKSCATDIFLLRAVIYKPSPPIRIVLVTHFWVVTHGLRNTGLTLRKLINLKKLATKFLTAICNIKQHCSSKFPVAEL